MRGNRSAQPLLRFVTLLVLLSIAFVPGATTPAFASHTPNPASVTIAGSLQSELGCPGDWQPDCAATHMADQGNLVYLFFGTLPTGNYEYKIAINDTWTENYGSNFRQDGPNIGLSLPADRVVRFYYDHKTHYIADNARNTIYTVPGSFNSELGCSGDWQPECLQTFMSDVDGDGIFTFVTESIPQAITSSKSPRTRPGRTRTTARAAGQNNVPFSVPGNGFRVAFSFNSRPTCLGVPGR